MVDLSGCGLEQNWVCPNDRHLALRAKLKKGWSVKTQHLQRFGYQSVPLDPVERDMICEVIRRAEALDHREQERVGRLIERLDNMKRNVMGSGANQCILCGDRFGILGSPCLRCLDCKKTVCHKCSIEASNAEKETAWRCKICAETREIWKKSGAWFFKSLPKYVLPSKKNVSADGKLNYGFRTNEKLDWSQNQNTNDDSSSDDDHHIFSRHYSPLHNFSG